MSVNETTFREWRKRLKLSQREAAEALGISDRQLRNYEAGAQPVPRYIELACAALALGLKRYPE